ncbi:MAG: VacJ family lipoprotein [SAR324 cluster bacterium]|nr:VacJ family lipoprotein [SAR324 cluster bacterium]
MIKVLSTILLSSLLWTGCSSHSPDFTLSAKNDRLAARYVAQLGPSPTENDQEDDDDIFENEFADEFENEFGEEKESEIFDPLSGYNRLMTDINDTIYIYALKPVASGYQAVMPEIARQGISRFFNNLLFPVRFVNNILQMKFKNAGEEFARFGVNTTIGVLGFADPAKDWLDLDAHHEDFGQTLGYYGVGSGFHIVLPILGPSNLRDSISLLPDSALDPISYIDPFETEVGIRVFDAVNSTSLHLGEYEAIKKDAIDLYPFLRDIYEQNRNKKIEE